MTMIEGMKKMTTQETHIIAIPTLRTKKIHVTLRRKNSHPISELSMKFIIFLSIRYNW